MSVTIVQNDIPIMMRAAITEAVLSGIGEQLEHWRVGLDQPENSSDYTITLEGPNRRTFELRFAGLEQTPDKISEAVKTVVSSFAAPSV